MEINPTPKDTLGRPLAEGDGVILTMAGPVLFRVAQIEGGLDPRLPPGMLRVHLFATAVLNVKAGSRHAELLRVGTLQDLGPMPFEMNAVEPAKE